MSENDTSVKALFADHPKLTGVLFTMLLLLTQAGSVAAGNAGCTAGP